MQRDVVWFGVMRCGEVRCGMVWCGDVSLRCNAFWVR